MLGRPQETEAASYYFKCIAQVDGDDPLRVLRQQLDEFPSWLSAIPEKQSLHRYAPDKWSIRQVVNHVADCERLFCFRAFWFARGFDSPLPSFDQDVAARAAAADDIAWAAHVDDLRNVRLASLTFFESLAPDAWTRTGIASDNPFSVRALAFIAAGHFAHHFTILKERYLGV